VWCGTRAVPDAGRRRGPAARRPRPAPGPALACARTAAVVSDTATRGAGRGTYSASSAKGRSPSALVRTGRACGACACPLPPRLASADACLHTCVSICPRYHGRTAAQLGGQRIDIALQVTCLPFQCVALGPHARQLRQGPFVLSLRQGGALTMRPRPLCACPVDGGKTHPCQARQLRLLLPQLLLGCHQPHLELTRPVPVTRGQRPLSPPSPGARSPLPPHGPKHGVFTFAVGLIERGSTLGQRRRQLQQRQLACTATPMGV
jgi:hypothetical protein